MESWKGDLECPKVDRLRQAWPPLFSVMMAEVEPEEEEEDVDEDVLDGSKVINADDGDADKPRSKKNSKDDKDAGSSKWDKAKKLKKVYTGPMGMVKPKMDMAKALTIMGFSSTRSLDPHTNDTKAVLSDAVDKKGLLRQISLKLYFILKGPLNNCYPGAPTQDASATTAHTAISVYEVYMGVRLY